MILELNNNPFKIKGRMHRIPYFVTINILYITILLFRYFFKLIKNYIEGNEIVSFDFNIIYLMVSLYVFMYIGIFIATVKRLRDCRQNSYLAIISFCPYLNMIFAIFCSFLIGQYEDDNNSKIFDVIVLLISLAYFVCWLLKFI